MHSKGEYKQGKLEKKKITGQYQRQPSEWEKIIVNKTIDKGLISKVYKQLTQCQKNKQASQKVGNRPRQTFAQRRQTDG